MKKRKKIKSESKAWKKPTFKEFRFAACGINFNG